MCKELQHLAPSKPCSAQPAPRVLDSAPQGEGALSNGERVVASEEVQKDIEKHRHQQMRLRERV
jgi:hypothetical protein